MMRGRKREIVAWVASALWAAAIFALSSLPGSSVPGRFGSLAHFIEYALLAALLCVALRFSRPWAAATVLALGLASAYGITDEFHQAFVPMRTPDVVDWLVDTAGAAVGAVSIAWLGARTMTALDSRRGRS